MIMNDNDIEWDLTEVFTSCVDPKIFKKSSGVKI